MKIDDKGKIALDIFKTIEKEVPGIQLVKANYDMDFAIVNPITNRYVYLIREEKAVDEAGNIIHLGFYFAPKASTSEMIRYLSGRKDTK